MDSAGDFCNNALDRLCGLVAPIARKYKITRMYLFGSRARDRFDSDSDYDIYVVSDDMTSLIQLSSLMLDLKDALGSKVDVVVENEYINENLLKNISRDRILIYED